MPVYKTKTLPGVIRGLLQSGSPFVSYFGALTMCGVVLRPRYEAGDAHIATEGQRGDPPTVWTAVEFLQLVLQDAHGPNTTGIDHALRWVAQVVSYDLEDQLGSPAFTREPERMREHGDGWWLNGTEGPLFLGPKNWAIEWSQDHEEPVPDTPPEDYGAIVVTGLDDIEDAVEALRLVVLALARQEKLLDKSCPRYGAPCPHPDKCATKCVYALGRRDD